MTEIFNKMNYSQDIINRFWSKVNVPDDWKENDQCWKWIGRTDKDLYGNFSIYSYKSVRAPRFMWEFYNGSILNELQVLHKCDNPNCVNPNHLFLGTTQDNTQDKINKGRQIKGSKIGTSILTENDVQKMLNNILNNSYLSIHEILNDFPIAKPTFENIIYKNGWKHIKQEFDMIKIREIISSFKKNKKKKLSEKNVREIKKILSEGIITYQELSNIYNIDTKTISDIKTGRSWSYVTI